MQILKAAEATAAGRPTPAQLEKIHQLTKAPLAAEALYVFSVRLCDDAPDRDFERFDTWCLPRLAELFRGKTGILDHNWSSEKQVARIFDTEVVQEGAVTALKAWCYMLASETELVAEIEAGIKKEVSVGCAMGRQTCSICGSPYGSCEHRKGQQYGGEMCLCVLSEPTDAYEFSFVAVPAQREAGVTKGYREQAERKALEQEAALGREYLKTLQGEVVRLGLLLELGVDAPTLRAIAEKLEPEQLSKLQKAFSSRAAKLFAPRPQLSTQPEKSGIEPEYLI